MEMKSTRNLIRLALATAAACVAMAVQPASALATVFVSVTDAPDPVVAGELLTYRLEVWSNGFDSLLDGKLEFALPETTTFESYEARSRGTSFGGSGLGFCTTPEIGTSGVLVCGGRGGITGLLGWQEVHWITVRATEPGTITATATLSSLIAGLGYVTWITETVTTSVLDSPPPTPVDSDGDGMRDSADNCAWLANPDQRDADGDTIGDACDLDDDNDDVFDRFDNCATVANPDQADLDRDTLGDACDPTDDRTAAQVVADTLDLLESIPDTQSLTAKLEQALARIDDGNTEAACGALRALINEARAQTDKNLTAAQAAQLIAEAENALARLHCG
jgi:hypothetical protein